MEPLTFAILSNCILVIGLMSIFFGCFTLLLVLLWPKRYYLPEVIIQFLLAVVLNMTNGFVRLLQSDHKFSCIVTAIIDQYSLLVVFFWVTIPSYELTNLYRDSVFLTINHPAKPFECRARTKNRQIAYSLIGWGSPFAITSATLVVHFMYSDWTPNVYGGIYCTVNQQIIFLLATVMPQFFLMFISLSCFAFLVHQYTKSPFTTELKEAIYFVLLIMAWTETLWCLNLMYNLIISDVLYLSYWFLVSILPGTVGLFVTYRVWKASPIESPQGGNQTGLYSKQVSSRSGSIRRPPHTLELEKGLLPQNTTPNIPMTQITGTAEQRFSPSNLKLFQEGLNNSYAVHAVDLENPLSGFKTQKSTSCSKTSNRMSQYDVPYSYNALTLPSKLRRETRGANRGNGNLHQSQRKKAKSDYFIASSEHSEGSNSANGTHAVLTVTSVRRNSTETNIMDPTLPCSSNGYTFL